MSLSFGKNLNMRFWLLLVCFVLSGCDLSGQTELKLEGPLTIGDWEEVAGGGAVFWLPTEPEIIVINCRRDENLLRFTSSGHSALNNRNIALKKPVRLSLKIITTAGVLKRELIAEGGALPRTLLSPNEPVLKPLYEGEGRFLIEISNKHLFQLPITPILSSEILACKT